MPSAERLEARLSFPNPETSSNRTWGQRALDPEFGSCSDCDRTVPFLTRRKRFLVKLRSRPFGCWW